MTSIFEFVVLISSVCIIPLEANPVPRNTQQRWRTPCSPATTDLSDVPVLIPPIKTVLEKLETELKIAAKGTQAISTIYRERIQNRMILRYLDKRPPIKELQIDPSQENNTSSYLQNIAGLFQDGYRQVSLLVIYWEMMKQDQIEYEYDEYVNEMDKTVQQLYGVLCTLYTTIHQTLNGDIDTFLNGSEIPTEIRNIGRVTNLRQKRNYLIAKDSVKILTSMTRRFSSLLTH